MTNTNSMLARTPRLSDLALVVIFLFAISVPLAGSFFGLELTSQTKENRLLASFPPLAPHRRELTEFPKKFEAFFSDRFGLRNTLIWCLNHLRVHFLGVSSSRKVIIGNNGWLYFTEDPIGADYDVTRPFTRWELNQWQTLLETRRDWLVRRGIRYLFVIAPDKQTIYPEHLPAGVRNHLSGPSRMDQLLAHLRKHTTVEVLDLRQTLRAGKVHGKVYHQLDSHWNERGAVLATERIIQTLSSRFVPMNPSRLADFVVREKAGQYCDLARMLNLADFATETMPVLSPRRPRRSRRCQERVSVTQECRQSNYEPKVMATGDRALPKAVLLHDSFGPAMSPFLAEHFQRMVCAPVLTFDPAVVETERPHVVIHEMVERRLYMPLRNDPIVMRQFRVSHQGEQQP